jgi:hypothetical protein
MLSRLPCTSPRILTTPYNHLPRLLLRNATQSTTRPFPLVRAGPPGKAVEERFKARSGVGPADVAPSRLPKQVQDALALRTSPQLLYQARSPVIYMTGCYILSGLFVGLAAANVVNYFVLPPDQLGELYYMVPLAIGGACIVLVGFGAWAASGVSLARGCQNDFPLAELLSRLLGSFRALCLFQRDLRQQHQACD